MSMQPPPAHPHWLAQSSASVCVPGTPLSTKPCLFSLKNPCCFTLDGTAAGQTTRIDACRVRVTGPPLSTRSLAAAGLKRNRYRRTRPCLCVLQPPPPPHPHPPNPTKKQTNKKEKHVNGFTEFTGQEKRKIGRQTITTSLIMTDTIVLTKKAYFACESNSFQWSRQKKAREGMGEGQNRKRHPVCSCAIHVTSDRV